MDITILIAVADDIRIRECIKSIDEECEVLVVANGATKEVEDILADLKKQWKDDLRVVRIPDRNLSKARDIGISEARYDKVFLMDTDCVFEKGTIRSMYNALNDYKIARGKIIYRAKDFQSHIVKKVREYTLADSTLAYAPCLCVRKDVIDEVGGYYFDHDIHWIEDSEFTNRVRKAKIQINYLPDSVIYHAPLKFSQDLRSAYRYGGGKRIAVRKGLLKGVGSCWGQIIPICFKEGVGAAIFLAMWNLYYCVGYFTQPYFNTYRVNEKLKELKESKKA